MHGTIVFRGPRAKMGIYSGLPTRVIPHNTTGRADYFGPLVNRAARYCHAAARGGQVLIAKEFMKSIIGRWVGTSSDMASGGLMEYCVYFDAQRQRTWPWLFMRRHHMGVPAGPPVPERIAESIGLMGTGGLGLYASLPTCEQGTVPPACPVAPVAAGSGHAGCPKAFGCGTEMEAHRDLVAHASADLQHADAGRTAVGQGPVEIGEGSAEKDMSRKLSSCCGRDIACGMHMAGGGGGGNAGLQQNAGCFAGPSFGATSSGPTAFACRTSPRSPRFAGKGDCESSSGMVGRASTTPTTYNASTAAAESSGGVEMAAWKQQPLMCSQHCHPVMQQQQPVQQPGMHGGLLLPLAAGGGLQLLPPTLMSTGLGAYGISSLHHPSRSRRPSQLQTLQEGQEISVCSSHSRGGGWEVTEPPRGLGMEGVRQWVGQLNVEPEPELRMAGKGDAEGLPVVAGGSRVGQLPEQQQHRKQLQPVGSSDVSSGGHLGYEVSFAGGLKQPGLVCTARPPAGTTAIGGALVAVDGLQVQSSPNSKEHLGEERQGGQCSGGVNFWGGSMDCLGTVVPLSGKQSSLSEATSVENLLGSLRMSGQQGYGLRAIAGYNILDYGWSRTHNDKIRRCSWRSDCAVLHNADSDLNQLKMRLGARRPSATSDMLLARGGRLIGYVPIDPRAQHMGYAWTTPGSRRSSNVSALSADAVLNTREYWPTPTLDEKMQDAGLQGRRPSQQTEIAGGRVKESGSAGRDLQRVRGSGQAGVSEQLPTAGPGAGAAAEQPWQRRPSKSESLRDGDLAAGSGRTTHRSSARSGGSGGVYGTVSGSGDQGDSSSRHSSAMSGRVGRGNLAGASGPSGQQLLLSELGQQVGLGLAASGGLHSSSRLRLVNKRRRQMSYCFDMETSGPGTPADGQGPLRGLNLGATALLPVASQGSSSHRASLSSAGASSCAAIPSVVAEEEGSEARGASWEPLASQLPAVRSVPQIASSVDSSRLGQPGGLGATASLPGALEAMGTPADSAAGVGASAVARAPQRLVQRSMPVVQPRPEPQTLQSLRVQNPAVSSKSPSVHGTEASIGFEGPSMHQTCSAVMSGTWLWARQLLVHDLGTFK